MDMRQSVDMSKAKQNGIGPETWRMTALLLIPRLTLDTNLLDNILGKLKKCKIMIFQDGMFVTDIFYLNAFGALCFNISFYPLP